MNEKIRNIVEGKEALAESDVKDLLREFMIPTTKFRVVKREAELNGIKFPVAFKVCSPKILHKADVGGVRLNVNGEQELREVFREFEEKFPGEDFLVEEMARQGVEIIIGLFRDTAFGLSIMLGIGGVLTELYQDATFRVVPIERYDAELMLSELRGRRLLEGFRNIKTDREAVIRLLLSVSRLGEELEDYIDQMDLNPVIVYEKGLCVVDAKLILRKQPDWKKRVYG